MKNDSIQISLLRAVAVLMGCGTLWCHSAVNTPEIAAQSLNRLGLELLGQSKSAGGNQLLSPYSIQTALAMTLAGADGETRTEMARVLGLNGAESEIHASFAALAAALEEVSRRSELRTKNLAKNGVEGEPLSLAMANRLFGEQHYAFRPPFLGVVQEHYGAPLERVSFREDPQGARAGINRWVAQRTKDRILDLVPEDGVSRDTRLVLVNAIHFKSPWVEPFPSGATANRPFHVDGKTVREVPTLQRQARFGYSKRDGYTAVSVPYAGGELHFLILLPDAVEGLAELETKLKEEALAACSNLPGTEVQLSLPKFKLQPPVLKLSAALRALGMKSAFDVPAGSANFDRMAERKPDDYLFISEVFHKTFIELDEKGTEAAAATAVSMMRATSVIAAPKPPIEVRVDRPFLFAIQHRASKACLFLGRLSDPR
ncbi:MAG: serpin family protein [Verrucomicrobiales bacterium]|nr:serpin family protein [Verrucomicrobiales bacterium]